MAAAAEEAPAAPAAGGLRALTTKREAFRGEMQVRSPPPPPPSPLHPAAAAAAEHPEAPGTPPGASLFLRGLSAGVSGRGAGPAARAVRGRGRGRGRGGRGEKDRGEWGGAGGGPTWPGPARFPLHWAACPLGLTEEARPSPHLFRTRRHG